MSEKKDTRKRYTQRVDKDLAERLEADALRRGWTVNNLINSIIGERYGLGGKCPAEVLRGASFICVWGRQKNTPNIRKLAESVSEKDDLCRACTTTRELVMRAETAEALATQDRIIELPFCTGGGEMREQDDGSRQLFCMLDIPNLWVEIDYCKRRRYGKPCEGYKTTQITVHGTKQKDMK